MEKAIEIILPYEDAQLHVPVWACEEDSVDFRSDAYRAARCTMSFAATELKAFLARTLSDYQIVFSCQKSRSRICIELAIVNPASLDGSFSLVPTDCGLRIHGVGRPGVLYGVYELLRMQGWRWYGFGADGEVSPEPTESLVFPDGIEDYTPSMSFGRGFDFEGMSLDSVDLYLWMARNRMSVAGYRPGTAPLCSKLGLTAKTGGHIFEWLLDPDRVTSSGRTLWEDHSDWYGLPADGNRRKDRALNIQLCVSRPDMIEFAGDELVRLLKGEWSGAGRIDIWGFDTWGSVCMCPECSEIGNGTDHALHFLAELRNAVNRAVAEGKLDHNVTLVMCSYEGTATLSAPTKEIPQVLIDSGDCVVFYPIKRCYRHTLLDPDCNRNLIYSGALRDWCRLNPNMPIVLGEYYNVSKFEDLPLLFTRTMAQDIKDYHKLGVRGLTYMHVPLVNWATRTLTQCLYTQLLWDVDTDVEVFVSEYFKGFYGPYSGQMRRVYSHIEKAWELVASWRAWGPSVLTSLQSWDGAKPDKPLEVDDHLNTSDEAIQNGLESLSHLEDVLALVDECYAQEQVCMAQKMMVPDAPAVNPVQARELEQANAYAKRLGEDMRLLLYGRDTMALMTLMLQYHQALFEDDKALSDITWSRIKELSQRMDSYYIPICYDYPGPGLHCKDALTRTQLRDVIYRCLKNINLYTEPQAIE